MPKTTARRRLDSIIVSVIGNRLDAISKEIGQTMLRTSRSPIFSEARDFVTAIFDGELRLVAQTAYIPVIMGALPFVIRQLRATFGDDVQEGDVFICNDPYRAGNNHPPDINIIKPVLQGGKVAFWAVSKGHHADVGGGGVAGYNPAAKFIWEEGLRIPPSKLYIAGKPNKALWDTILLNVHLPFLVEGDLNCQVGAVTIGSRGLRALLDKYGKSTLDSAINAIFDASEEQMRAAIRTVPSGVYRGEAKLDHDGINKDRQITIRVAIKIKGGDLTFDFEGSDPQVAGYVNSTLPNTTSSAFIALFLSLGSDIRFNEGALRALHVVAPEGSIVNPREPAPVTGCTVSTSQAIVEAVWLALAQAAPDRVDAAWSRWCAPASMGMNPRTGRPFGDIHFMCKGGGGASQGSDGWDHLAPSFCAGSLRAPDPELHELVDPYTVLQYEYWPDSAGAGEWRGGMGTIYRWRIETDGIPLANFGGGISESTAPFGLEGGKAAPPHEVYLQKGGTRTAADTESFFQCDKGDVFEIFQSGGGGFGDPRKRSIEKVSADVRDGIVSVAKAREDYGVVIDSTTLKVDEAATRALRGGA
ncbi:MAG: hydantoinase B/oxoprolinase family protein [Steroidobacteraceae bacterium]